MNTKVTPQICFFCKHFNARAFDTGLLAKSCTAFPTLIPFQISNGDFDHRYPFPTDGGIQFEIFEDVNALPMAVRLYFANHKENPLEIVRPIFTMLEERRRRGFAKPPLED